MRPGTPRYLKSNRDTKFSLEEQKALQHKHNNLSRGERRLGGGVFLEEISRN